MKTRVRTAKVGAAYTMVKYIKRIGPGFRNAKNYQTRIP
ncbi:hypothetical protein [Arthrobacter globiformis]|nr:hypothetical protein [Arthrobacter globiformis]